MISAQSHRSRRVLGRLDRGTDLIKGISDLCVATKVRSGEFRASGWLEEVELQEYDQRSRSLRPRSLATPVQLLTLTGTIAEQEGGLAVSARAILSRETDNGVQVLGGLVHSARVFLVELVVDAFDDLIVRRGTESKTGVTCWTEMIETAPPEASSATNREARSAAVMEEASVPMAVQQAHIQVMKEAQLRGAASVPPPAGPDKGPLRAKDPFGLKGLVPGSPPAPAPQVVSAPAPAPVAQAPDWQAVKAASEAQAEDAQEAEAKANPPRTGDVVEHTTFGRCTIEKVEMELDRVSVRVRSGRLVQLSLEYLSLEPAGRQGGVRLFKAVKRR